MPFESKLNLTTRTAEIERSGQVTFAELRRGVDAILEHPEFSRMQRLLSDLTQADYSKIDVSDFRVHARMTMDSLDWSGMSIALVAPDSLTYGMCRMFDMLVELDNLWVFRSRPAALEWLQD